LYPLAVKEQNQNNANIHKVELDNEVGEELIKNALKYPTKKGWEIAEIIFGAIGDYVPPMTEETTPDEDIEE
jgi:hypothetical protein